MRRVAVVGCGGAGKSTLARELGGLLGLPVTHLDRLFWQPGWTPTDEERWREVQRGLVAEDAWLLDGNYGRSLDIRLRAADTVIFLDFPRRTCLRRAVRRMVANWGRDDQAPGCPERIDLSFLRWIWRFRGHSRRRVLAAVAEHGQHARQLLLTSPADVRALLADLTSRGRAR